MYYVCCSVVNKENGISLLVGIGKLVVFSSNLVMLVLMCELDYASVILSLGGCYKVSNLW